MCDRRDGRRGVCGHIWVKGGKGKGGGVGRIALCTPRLFDFQFVFV